MPTKLPATAAASPPRPAAAAPDPAPPMIPDSPAALIKALRLELDQVLATKPPTLRVPSGTAGDLAWLAPQRRAQFLALENITATARIAVVAHVYYRDLWSELSAAIANLDQPFDLFVSLTSPNAEDLRDTVLARWPQAYILTVDNHGRDILPFLALLRTGVLFRYELICKIHTKRSHWHHDGETWRRELIGGVLGSAALVRGIVLGFDRDPTLGMVVADGHTYSKREYWEGNRKHLMRLFSFLDMDDSLFSLSFAGGSIYWARPAFLRLLSELPFRPDDFEPEPVGSDGATVHAIERLISLLCYEAGLTIRETSQIVTRDLLERTTRD